MLLERENRKLEKLFQAIGELLLILFGINLIYDEWSMNGVWMDYEWIMNGLCMDYKSNLSLQSSFPTVKSVRPSVDPLKGLYGSIT